MRDNIEAQSACEAVDICLPDSTRHPDIKQLGLKCVCVFVCCFVVNKEDMTFASGVSCKENKRMQTEHSALNSSIILLLHLFFLCVHACVIVPCLL